ncbi:MAG: precorrin-6A/cobalt-precorrin-6A reductase, partial [Euryarchaeota archaeon]|nr:precorrin-6A/cobalt-precorrin-6A reductase [Euryarchaeota archaeon]
RALELGVDERMLLCLHPPLSLELEKALLRQYHAEVLVMKDSGASGGAETKLRACEELGIRAVVVQRPALHYPEMCHSLQEALRWAERYIALRR